MAIEYIELMRPYEFKAPFTEQFIALVYVVDKTISSAEQMKLCDQIINQGCRFTISAGQNCQDWENCFDHSYISNVPDVTTANLVLTTSHQNDSLSEVAFFFSTSATLPTEPHNNRCVILIGDNIGIRAQIENEIDLAISAQ